MIILQKERQKIYLLKRRLERENIRLSVADELFSNARKPVIISTVSIVLQNQLVEKDLPLANQICQGKLRGIVIKSHRHYLDLQCFKATLNQPTPQKNTLFIKWAFSSGC